MQRFLSHQPSSVTRTDREKLNAHRARVVWFTGLSGAGKTTLANALEAALHQLGVRTFILDGDSVRQGLNKDLGFSLKDRSENIRRVAEVAKLMLDAGVVVITAFISPLEKERDEAKNIVGPSDFFEVYVNTPLDVCEERDPKGLYKKARAGVVQMMTGIDSPYEPPKSPDFIADGSAGAVDDVVASLLTRLEREIAANTV